MRGGDGDQRPAKWNRENYLTRLYSPRPIFLNRFEATHQRRAFRTRLLRLALFPENFSASLAMSVVPPVFTDLSSTASSAFGSSRFDEDFMNFNVRSCALRRSAAV